MLYTFFDPDMNKRGLGQFCILSQIEEATRRGLDYVYLGYWVRECQKMNYKTDYRPIEMLINQQWLMAK